MHVGQADRTVLLKSRFFALVVIEHRHRIAAATLIAVKLRVSTAYSTYSTFRAVIDLLCFGIVIIKRTDRAVILCKVFLALDASLRFGLFFLTT